MSYRHSRCRWLAAIAPVAAVILALAPLRTIAAQAPPLDSLIARALEVDPRVQAARARHRAMEARVGPAAALPDPMLMVGVQNLAVGERWFADFMTMKMVGLSQTLPARGSLASARRAAESDARAARLGVDEVSRAVERDVRSAYYDVWYADAALALVERTRDVLVAMISATEARYAVGTAGQSDLLRARVEVAKLGEEAVRLHEDRGAAVARLNSYLDRAPGTPLVSADLPPRIRRAAVADSASAIRFVSPSLGSRAADSPLPALQTLQARAVEESPALRAQEARVAAQTARAELARLARRPDINLSLQYGQRDGFSDMVSAVVSLPLQVRRARNQDQSLVAEQADLAAVGADLHGERAMLLAEVARLHAELERARSALALLVKAVIPQSAAALDAALSNYQAGRTEFTTVLDAQATLFNSQASHLQQLNELAKRLAELQQVVGTEILP